MLQQLLNGNMLILCRYVVQVILLEPLPVSGLRISSFALELIEEVGIRIKHQVHGPERKAATMIMANLIHQRHPRILIATVEYMQSATGEAVQMWLRISQIFACK